MYETDNFAHIIEQRQKRQEIIRLAIKRLDDMESRARQMREADAQWWKEAIARRKREDDLFWTTVAMLFALVLMLAYFG